VAFKPHHKFSAELGGYASKGNESGDNRCCTGTLEEREINEKWITVTGNSKTKKLLNPKPKPKLHNAFAILFQPDAPPNCNAPSLAQQMDRDRTIIPPAHKNNAGNGKLPGANTSSKH
jgi:hypothetical protein